MPREEALGALLPVGVSSALDCGWWLVPCIGNVAIL